MGRAIRFRPRSGTRRTLQELDRLLDDAYGAPEADLDNKADSLDEAVYMVLSFQTDLDRFRLVWDELRAAFPAWESLAQAPLRQVVKTLRVGGLQEQKARTIKKLLKVTKQETGTYSLEALRDMEDDEAERFLTRLPGLSWTAARCVLLYSLGRDVFPVDGNTFRIFKRAGVLGRGSVYRRRGLHDGLQDAVETSRRKPFHINLVVHGQRTCLPRRPRCSSCPARNICPMCGVPAEITSSARGERICDSGAVTVSRKRVRA
jgi:endonuclease III